MMPRGARSFWPVLLMLAVAGPAVGAADRRAADAVERKDLTTLRRLLQQKADVNGSQPDGTTALHWAAHWDDVATADLLIRAGARVDAVTDLGVFPLWLACSNGHAAMVERLLAAGADPRAAMPAGETALMMCARTGTPDALRALLARGADPNARDTRRGQTALMWAAAAKHGAAVRALVELHADVNARSSGGFTPLLFAAREGDLDSARLLVAAGARVNDTTPDEESALLVAAASMTAVTVHDYGLVTAPSGHEAVASFLVAHLADVNHADSFGMTALHRAVETGKVGLLKALLAAGAHPNARLVKGLPFRRGDYVSRAGYGGATPFWLAAMLGEADMMRILAAAGADPHLPTLNGTTPLMVAAGLGQTDSRIPPESRLLDAVKLAIDLGGDVNEANNAGQTAVHGAASISGHAIIRFLAARGATLDARDRQGRTPVDVTFNIQRPRPETRALIEELLKLPQAKPSAGR